MTPKPNLFWANRMAPSFNQWFPAMYIVAFEESSEKLEATFELVVNTENFVL